MQPTNQILKTFLEDNSFVNQMKSNTCFKSKPGSSIDLILTNKPKRFQNSGGMETGVSDPHDLIFSILETTFAKMPPNKLKYRPYRKLKFKFKMLNNYPKKLVINLLSLKIWERQL